MTQATSSSVVVCAYTLDRWDDTVRAVDSALGQTHRPDQVIVVIDHNDTLLDRARTQWPQLAVVPNAGRQGLSGARNTAIALADHEIVAFLDDDAAARPDWLAELAAPFADPHVLATGGCALPVWATATATATAPAMLPPELLWIVGCTYTGQPTTSADVRNVMGCSMAFRRSVFAAVGGFAEGVGRVGTIPLGCEETELCIRVRQHDAQARIVFVPAAVVDHVVGAERGTWRYLLRRSFAEGISKAVVSGLVGSGDALSSERAYTRSVLPRGVVRELRRGRPAGALAIVACLAFAAAGFARGRCAGRMAPAAVTATSIEVPAAA